MEIRIGKPGRVCAGSNKQFEHGETVVSVMRVENQQLARHDFAKPVWDEERASGAIAVWETQYSDPSMAQQEPPEKFSPLRKIFYDSAESEDRVQIAKAYLAAQLLRRQKVFRLVKESDDSEGDARVALFMDRIGNRLAEARDPHLTYAEMEAARVELMKELATLEGTDSGEATESGESAAADQGPEDHAE
ncbi:MAG: hypothetical protein HUU46_05290 [Candidatus Hydrogenedentes bacterium]|nr:hypothetical protein [Candidatus Hydrogenedentota bacterium]